MTIKNQKSKIENPPALILVDIQNDFLPTGTLPVPQGDLIIPWINAIMPRFTHIIATQDWHPANHGSFAANHPGKKPGDTIRLAGQPQILWPVHCVQNTEGAKLAFELDRSRITHIIHKGADPEIDSYSDFFDNNHRKPTGLHDYLQSHHITTLYLAGLATDYCVKATALDARQLGYEVHLIEDACRGVNLQPNDVANALQEMQSAGVKLISTTDLRLGADL